jgi:hypothetical protein
MTELPYCSSWEDKRSFLLSKFIRKDGLQRDVALERLNSLVYPELAKEFLKYFWEDVRERTVEEFMLRMPTEIKADPIKASRFEDGVRVKVNALTTAQLRKIMIERNWLAEPSGAIYYPDANDLKPFLHSLDVLPRI